MYEFPQVPYWWRHGSKFKRLTKGFEPPHHIVGFDTETCEGSILTQQFSSKHAGDSIFWCNSSNALDKFLSYLEKNFSGYAVIYAFNLKFDLAIILRQFIEEFMKDDFTVKYQGWEIKVFCTSNWFAAFKKSGLFVRILDVRAYFPQGNLDKVSKSFGLETSKLKMPPMLGYHKYTKKDKNFVDYAMVDAILCREMGEKILDMHAEFDIPISTSSANFAEKVFRRNFMPDGFKMKFPNFDAQRMAEFAYHGGKNAYYLESPTLVRNCYEYDFNAAYGYAMYNLPSFLSGEYVKTRKFNDKYVGVYQVKGKLKECKYGILYDTHFRYLRDGGDVIAMVTSHELQEAIETNEFQMESCIGWLWKPDTEENPIKNYIKYFWERKNAAEKGTVQYLFNKLCLNSLYGKWIQRNPLSGSQLQGKLTDGEFELEPKTEIAGGMYHPFIASLITGSTRARLHREEHRLNAIECSTDSVKSRTYVPEYKKVHYLGRMQLETMSCKDCDKETSKFDGLFIRNRLNLLMDKKGHILKAALHGFWGNPKLLKQLWQDRKTNYQVERMPLIREALNQIDKRLFETRAEDRSISVDWSTYREI